MEMGAIQIKIGIQNLVIAGKKLQNKTKTPEKLHSIQLPEKAALRV